MGVNIDIARKPEDCDFDLEEVLKSVKYQNSHGNILISWTIDQDRITLQYEGT